jgi:hypothetical protein
MSSTAPTGTAGLARPSSGADSSLRRFLLARPEGTTATVLLSAAALLMVASGLIHLYLWHLAYRHVATLGPLFLVQALAAIVLAVALPLGRRGFLLVAAVSLMAGTIVGFILVTTVGLFGFTLTVITGWAVAALLVEAPAIVALLTAAALLWRAGSSSLTSTSI